MYLRFYWRSLFFYILLTIKPLLNCRFVYFEIFSDLLLLWIFFSIHIHFEWMYSIENNLNLSKISVHGKEVNVKMEWFTGLVQRGIDCIFRVMLASPSAFWNLTTVVISREQYYPLVLHSIWIALLIIWVNNWMNNWETVVRKTNMYKKM